MGLLSAPSDAASAAPADTVSDALTVARQVASEAVAAGLADAVFIYGSTVAGGARPGSDIDLLPLRAGAGGACDLQRISELAPQSWRSRLDLKTTSYMGADSAISGDWAFLMHLRDAGEIVGDRQVALALVDQPQPPTGVLTALCDGSMLSATNPERSYRAARRCALLANTVCGHRDWHRRRGLEIFAERHLSCAAAVRTILDALDRADATQDGAITDPSPGALAASAQIIGQAARAEIIARSDRRVHASVSAAAGALFAAAPELTELTVTLTPDPLQVTVMAARTAAGADLNLRDVDPGDRDRMTLTALLDEHLPADTFAEAAITGPWDPARDWWNLTATGIEPIVGHVRLPDNDIPF